MLLPEDGLDRLVEQLRTMSVADRKAILARLGTAERRRVRARLAARPNVPAEPTSPYSTDIAARIAAADSALTPSGRKALDAFLSPVSKSAPRQERRGPSLAQTMGGLLRPRAKTP